ncbi:MAG: hypothetical protein Q9179_007352, partial [Wetmoreana sp. 5 TL-2023]
AVSDVIKAHPVGRPVRPLGQLGRRPGARSSSLFQPQYPSDWAIDKSLFRRALQQLKIDLVGDHLQPDDVNSSHQSSEGNTQFLDRFFGYTPDDGHIRPIDPTHQRPSTDARQGLSGVIGPLLGQIDLNEGHRTSPTAPSDPSGQSESTFSMGMTFTPEQFQQLLDRLTPQRNVTTPTPATVTVNDRFRARDIGFFDPDDAKAVESLRVKADDGSLARNLDQCLLGKAERWYTEEISDITRAGLQTSVDLWCKELEARFRESPNTALDKSEKARYTVSDARARKDPEEYIQSIVACGKNAGTATTENAQVRTAYNHVDVQLRVMLPIPTDETTINQFLGQASFNNFGKQRRTFSYGNQSSSSSPEPRQGDWHSRAKPNNRSDRPIKQEYVKEVRQERYQSNRGDRPQKKGDNRDTKGKGKAERAYHMSTDNDKNQEPESDSEGSIGSQGYNREYYHGTPYGHDDDDQTPDDDHDDPNAEVIDVGFMAPKAPKLPRPRHCDRCRTDFPSNTKYHAHRARCLKVPSSTADAKASDRYEGTLRTSPADLDVAPKPDKWSTRATAHSETEPPQIVTSQAPTHQHDPG